MLSVEKTKELLKDKNLSEKKTQEIKNAFRHFSEIIYEKWFSKRKKLKTLDRDD